MAKAFGWNWRRELNAVVLACAVSGCASRSVEVASDPPGAEVQTMGGETLGTTPVILRNEALEKAMSSDGLMAIRLVGPGYLPQALMVEVRGADAYRLQMTKLDDNFFKRYVLRDYTAEHNFMVREMLNIQGLIRTKKFPEAEKQLLGFQERFPTIAMTHVMLSNLALLRGDRVLAKRYLLQAQTLDPEDPIILRTLGGMGAIPIQTTMPVVPEDSAREPAALPDASEDGH